MKIIVVHKNHHGGTRTLALTGWSKLLFSFCLLGVPALAGGLGGYLFAKEGESVVINQQAVTNWRHDLDLQQESVEETRQLAREKIHALTTRVAELQAKILRLDALGERLASRAKLDTEEFNFSATPAVGGPNVTEFATPHNINFIDTINELADKIDLRQSQLDTLDGLLAQQQLEDHAFLAGRPVKSGGWLSSNYGSRTDPFTGNVAWHNGIDYAGKDGAEIIAVAAGVVTWSGDRYGYGQMVEINHGQGYISRYAHNKANLVKVGDIVQRGETIAHMGSSGRSTGPHVHFEVYKHGRAVDPASYIRRASR